nr:MAG TPA: hypothetical protein [Caudoviricetes sp.]
MFGQSQHSHQFYYLCKILIVLIQLHYCME